MPKLSISLNSTTVSNVYLSDVFVANNHLRAFAASEHVFFFNVWYHSKCLMFHCFLYRYNCSAGLKCTHSSSKPRDEYPSLSAFLILSLMTQLAGKTGSPSAPSCTTLQVLVGQDIGHPGLLLPISHESWVSVEHWVMNVWPLKQFPLSAAVSVASALIPD